MHRYRVKYIRDKTDSVLYITKRFNTCEMIDRDKLDKVVLLAIKGRANGLGDGWRWSEYKQLFS